MKFIELSALDRKFERIFSALIIYPQTSHMRKVVDVDQENEPVLLCQITFFHQRGLWGGNINFGFGELSLNVQTNRNFLGTSPDVFGLILNSNYPLLGQDSAGIGIAPDLRGTVRNNRSQFIECA